MDASTHWDVNLRGNLRLWPNVSPNVEALLNSSGQEYDEAELLKSFPEASTDPRAVRNTFEILAYSGFVYREGDPARLLVTTLGATTSSFLGMGGDGRPVNQRNRHLLAKPLIRALSLVVEIRAIWSLMRGSANTLSNEELNRAMGTVTRLSDVASVSAKILASRAATDPNVIGDRIYYPQDFGTPRQSDQRKAMNPHFLLAGGGGLFITIQPDEEMRSLEHWAVPMIDYALTDDIPDLVHSSTAKEYALLLSEYASVQPDISEGAN